MNGNLNIGGNLSVSQFSSNKTITTTNYQLVVAEDLSLNGRLFVSGAVGIGTTAPAYTLDVSAASTAPFRVGVGSTNAVVVDSSGRVGINMTNPAFPLDVTGIIRNSGSFCGTYRIGQIVNGTTGYINGTSFTPVLKNTYGSGSMVYHYFCTDSGYYSYGILWLDSTGLVTFALPIAQSGYVTGQSGSNLYITNNTGRSYACYVTLNAVGPTSY